MHSSLKLAPIIPVSAYLDQPMGQHSHSLHCTTTGHDCCNCADELTMNMVTLCALYFTAIYFNMAVASNVLLQNPSPVPLGGVAVFTCSATSAAIVWLTDVVNITNVDSDPHSSMPVPRTSRITVLAISVNNNTNITCKTIEQQQSTIQLYIYGPPSEPGGLSSESVSDGELVFSWSPPWAPDGVQLHYTVTVTNLNTSVVRNYTTSNTSIALTRSDVGGEGECDQYVWSVIAVNPAGISGPAKYTTPFSLISTPNVTQHNILSCNENSTLVIIIKPPTEFSNNIIYTVNLLNANATNAKNANMEIMNLMFRIPDPHMWTNITVIVKNQCRESLIPVSFNGTVECPTSIATTTTEMTVPTPNITTPQSPSSLPTSTTNPTLGPVWAYGIGVILLLVAVVILALVPLLLYCRWRKRKRVYKTCCKSSSVKPSDHSSNEMMMIEKPETDQPVSDLKSKLPEYMTPADARKEAEVIKQQNGASGTLRSIQEAEQPLGAGVYDTPTFSKPTSVKQVMDMPTYSDVFQSKTNSLRTNQREGSTKGNSLKANQRETLNKQSHSSAPPPPPPPGPCDYASLQHDTGQPGAQENNTYDIPQDGDASCLYSSVGQPAQALSKDKYSELQHMSSSGDRVHGTTNVVEYSVVGPKTCPPTLPPPPSAEAVNELNL